MARKQVKRRRLRAGQRPDPTPEQSRIILVAFTTVFICIGLTALYSLWVSPCSWVGINLRNTGCIERISDSVSSVATLGDGRTVYVAEGVILVADEQRPQQALIHDRSVVERFLVAADDRTIASTALDEATDTRSLWVWQIGRDEPLWQTPIGDNVRLAAISPDGQQLIVATGDSERQVWTATSGELIAAFNGFGVAYAPDGKSVALTTEDELFLLDAEDFSTVKTLPTEVEGTLACPTYSPDGRYLAVGDIGALRVIDLQQEQVVFRLPESSRLHYCAFRFSPDSETLLVALFTPGRADAVVEFWQIADGRQQQVVDVSYTYPLEVALTADGQRLALGGSETLYFVSTVR